MTMSQDTREQTEAQARAAIREVQGLVFQHAKRGTDRLAPHAEGHLEAAVRSLLSAPESRIAIVTGFFVGPPETGHPETDGPIGAAQLAYFLELAGHSTEIITDTRCAGAVACCRATLGAAFGLRILDTAEQITALRDSWRAGAEAPSHLLSIERPAPARDGRPRNMRGLDLSEVTAPLHLLFEPGGPAPLPYTTIAICDGANEIGMGSIPHAAIEANPQANAEIHSTVAVQHLVLAGVANWGATALAAALALLEPKLRAALTEAFGAEQENALRVALFEGRIAVDGALAAFSSDTVDGIDAALGNAVTQAVIETALGGPRAQDMAQ